MERIHITQHSSLGAGWFAGWLFSIGYLHLDFLQALLGLIILRLPDGAPENGDT